MAPKCPIDIRQIHHVDEVVSGYETGSILSGWCFVMKRTLWELIGGLDEDFKFWCADNATVEQLKIVGVKPNLITKSLVQHLGSQTLKGLDKEVRHELTMVQVDLFNKKYNKNLFNRRKYDKMD
jgi:GT2 family glycosyltransferase